MWNIADVAVCRRRCLWIPFVKATVEMESNLNISLRILFALNDSLTSCYYQDSSSQLTRAPTYPTSSCQIFANGAKILNINSLYRLGTQCPRLVVSEWKVIFSFRRSFVVKDEKSSWKNLPSFMGKWLKMKLSPLAENGCRARWPHSAWKYDKRHMWALQLNILNSIEGVEKQNILAYRSNQHCKWEDGASRISVSRSTSGYGLTSRANNDLGRDEGDVICR